MFAFKYDEGGPWADDGINGMAKFFSRIEAVFDNVLKLKEEYKKNNVSDDIAELKDAEDKDLEYEYNKALKSITRDMEKQEYNTAIARLMELLNAMTKYYGDITKKDESTEKERLFIQIFEKYIIILSVFAPHFAQEMWQRLGYDTFLYNLKWPDYDKDKLLKDEIKLPIQINGKVRQVIEVERNLSKEELKKIIYNDEKVKQYISDKNILKEIYVENKIYNIVVKE